MVQKLKEEKDKVTLDIWKEQARSVRSPEDLAGFVKHLIGDYQHDYGTICHAIHAAMKAALSAVDHGPQGGITGFQASCIGWMLVDDLFGYNPESPKRIVDFENLIYPQYEDKFRSISPSTWEWAQKQAKKMLDEKPNAHPEVVAHWKNVAAGKVPFGLTVAA